MSFIEPWHDWLSTVIAGSRELMGNSWLDAFLEAPVWRFALPPGVCGSTAVIGLILPSVDRVGRYFPLSFAALTLETVDPGFWTDWLDTAENLGRRALDEDLPPDQLMPPAAPLSPRMSSASMGRWWSAGGPGVEAGHFVLPGLPDAARFAAMLGHRVPTEAP